MDPRISDLRAALAPRMPSASGIECIRALVSLGWMPSWWTDRACALEKGLLAVTVSLDRELSSEQVKAIAEVAGVPPIAFVDALEEILRQHISVYATELGELRRAGWRVWTCLNARGQAITDVLHESRRTW